MTDKPDRQNGHGLLPCPFCSSSTICIFRKGDGWKVECAGCDGGTAMHNQRGNAIAQWNTRAPTRDGAEAADKKMVPEIPFDPTNHHNALKCLYCNPKGLTFAPPKPAPDAMREALDDLDEIASYAAANSYAASNKNDKLTWSDHARKVRDVISALSISTVPPADGAQISQDREPTPDMRIAGGIAWAETLKTAETYVDCADACWKAMWDAR